MSVSKVKSKGKLPHIEVKVVRGLPDLSKDPVFIKKKQAAVEFLRKAGLPKGWEKKMK